MSEIEPEIEPLTPKHEGKTKGAILLSGTRFLTLILQLLLLPVVIRLIGKDENGAIISATYIAIYVPLVDLGLSDGGLVWLMRSQAKESNLHPWNVWVTYRNSVLLLSVLGALLVASTGFFLKAQGYPGDMRLLMALAGVSGALQYIGQSHMNWMLANRRYSALAVMNTLSASLSVILSFAFAWHFKSAYGYVLGTITGTLLAQLYATSVIHKVHIAQPERGRFDPELRRDFFRYGIKSYPSRVLSMVALSADRILLGNQVSKARLTDYDVSCRVPTALGDLTATTRSTIQRDLAEAHVKGEKPFAEAFDRYSRIAFAMAVVVVLVPSSFALPVLKILFERGHADSVPLYSGVAKVAMGMAIYKTFESYFTCHGYAMLASLKNKLLLIPVAWNALVTLFATLPMVRWLDLEGIALMNILIDVIQFAPLIWLAKRHVVPELELRKHTFGILSILAVGLFWSGIGFVLSGTDYFANRSFWLLPLAPIASIASFLMIFGTGLARTPEPIARRLGRFAPKK